MNKIIEFFGQMTLDEDVDWEEVVVKQICPYSGKKCYKVRKSTPDISIGTCTLAYSGKDVIICPNRLLERKQVFMDCIHLLKNHVPGNELHVIPEVSIPGGSVDFVLASVRRGKVEDFLGIEFQTLDTTGTIWPERQRLLIKLGIIEDDPESKSTKPFGMNWKMTAKTILVQMHHKSGTFESLNKHLVLVIQNPLLDYMRKEFDFSAIHEAVDAETVHIHSYVLEVSDNNYTIELSSRLSTTARGIETCLGLNADSCIDIEHFKQLLLSKIGKDTLLTL